MEHAERCQTITLDHPDEMESFDRAYAFEALARASAMLGEEDQAMHYLSLAREAGDSFENAESRALFLQDLQSGEWRGLI